jgi:hypothetical protein
MNTLLLEPNDVLFFRDGRPMEGALAGHGQGWPAPHTLNHALHAALWRSGLESHAHRSGQNAQYGDQRTRKFGSLVTAGPFPVCTNGEAHTWFFPRPADAQKPGATGATLLPAPKSGGNHLPGFLEYVAAATNKPSKDKVESWWSEGAWSHYLGTPTRDDLAARNFFKSDADFGDTEHSVGVGISDETGTAEEGRIYSAHYLRLRPGWRLGLLAKAMDKGVHGSAGVPPATDDLVQQLFAKQKGTTILVGGQQRACTAELHTSSRLPIPLGRSEGFQQISDGRFAVKWTLLSPAIWPEMKENTEKLIPHHPGGWLPNWIDAQRGQVLLKALDADAKRARRARHYHGRQDPLEVQASSIAAQLVCALVPKPQVISGYALENKDAEVQGGPKPTLLAVPAGAVYYFAAQNADEAAKLARVLNWHGDTAGADIRNRRSTLMGEKGFGLGVCSTWEPHPTSPDVRTSSST